MHYLDDLHEHIAPLAAALHRRVLSRSHPLLVGINGCQGSGKSTLAQFLAAVLHIGAGLRSVVLSIDDFYLEKSKRRQLSSDVHPLLLTRGVPGTHDLDRAHRILDQLSDRSRVKAVRLPGFDKSTDDCRLPGDCPSVAANPDLIILEGWCVGCPPQSVEDLCAPVNSLESEEDADGTWRHYVNDQLSQSYQPFFKRLNLLIMLVAPDFDCVPGWRQQQEQELIATRKASSSSAMESSDLQSEYALRRFINHYERLTKHQLKVLPPLADAVIELGRDHRMMAHSGGLYT